MEKKTKTWGFLIEKFEKEKLRNLELKFLSPKSRNNI